MSEHNGGAAAPGQTSPLHARHVEAGARMADFAGWEMPIDYGSVVAEHKAVREHVGAFDVSHLGTMWVTGEDAEAVVAEAFSNDVTALEPGTSQYSMCLNPEGGIIDDLLVYRLPTRFLVVPNAANTPEVAGRLLDLAKAHNDATVDVVELACIAVQGPEAKTALADVTSEMEWDVDPAAMTYLQCVELPGDGFLSRSGYSGEVGFEVFCNAEDAVRVWDGLISNGVQPVGLGARDTLRLEMGYPLHGNDISVDRTPVEAGAMWACKGANFIGRNAVIAAKEAGPVQRLRGLKSEGRRAPRPGDEIHVDGRQVGVVTSGSFSPILECGIGLGYVDTVVKLDDPVTVISRGREIPVTVVRPPFVEAKTKG